MPQTKLWSFIESITNIVVGYSVATLSQYVIFPIFNIHVSFKEHLYIGLWFTLVSLVRSYTLRRIFNKLS